MKVKRKKGYLKIIGGISFFGVLKTILFVWVPGQPFDTAYSVPILAGVIVVLVLGEGIIQIQIRKNKNR